MLPGGEQETRAAVFDQTGAFSIESIRPGSYKVYAFDTVPEGIWLDPDFLKEVESSGMAFDFAEGEGKTIQIPVLGKAENRPRCLRSWESRTSSQNGD